VVNQPCILHERQGGDALTVWLLGDRTSYCVLQDEVVLHEGEVRGLLSDKALRTFAGIFQVCNIKVSALAKFLGFHILREIKFRNCIMRGAIRICKNDGISSTLGYRAFLLLTPASIHPNLIHQIPSISGNFPSLQGFASTGHNT